MLTDFMLFTLCFFLHSVFLKSKKILKLNYNKIDHKTHLISSANSDMFWYVSAIICRTYKHLLLRNSLVMA